MDLAADRWLFRSAQEIRMNVSDVMTREVQVTTPEMSIRDAAQLMARIDAGTVPVGTDNKLVGILTDRDIAVRAVAKGLGPDTPVREIMSAEVKYCFDDQSVEEVARNMADIQVRRLPVVNRDKRLVGILSLGDLAVRSNCSTNDALRGISTPGGEHSQSAG
jgi:CBS domain-containing protein